MTIHFRREPITAQALPISPHGTATITYDVVGVASGDAAPGGCGAPGGRKRRSMRYSAAASTAPSGAVIFPLDSGRSGAPRLSARACGTGHVVPVYLLSLSACTTPRASVMTMSEFGVFCWSKRATISVGASCENWRACAAPATVSP